MRHPLELPRNLECWMADEPRAQTWLRDLPQTVEQLAARWGLLLAPPYQPGGVTAWVAPAVTALGERMVLKAGWRHDEALHEAAGLAAWNGDGCVRLVDSVVLGEANGLLLEACEPGTTLAASRPPVEQDLIVAGLVRRLRIEPPAGHGFRPLADMCDSWADGFDLRRQAAGIDDELAHEASALFRSLPRTADTSTLLHTDLHAGNVLRATREPWLAIDPKPYVGDPAYDVLQHMLNCEQRLLSDPVGFADRMACLAEIDRERLYAWLCARCMLESLEQPALEQVARTLRQAIRDRARG